MGRILWGLTAALLGAAQPASAGVYLVTFNGTVADGVDLTGEFGGGSVLTDLPVLVRFYIDDLTPDAQDTTVLTNRILQGGIYTAPYLGSPVKAEVTINGITHSIGYSSDPDAQTFSQARIADDLFGRDEFEYNSVESIVKSQRDAYNYINVSNLSTNLSMINGLQFGQPGSYTFDSQDSLGSAFQFYEHDYAIGRDTHFASGSFNFVSMSAQAAGVPEPSTWLMMIAGIGMTGIALRRARRAAAPTPATA